MCFPIHEDSYRTVENLIDGTCILVISVEVHISVCLYMYMYMCLKTMTALKEYLQSQADWGIFHCS